MKQRIFNMDNKQDVKDLFELLPDWVNWITKDKNSIKIFQDKPYFNKYNIWQTDKNENDIIKHRAIDFQSIAYTRCIIQRPINYQDWIGKWCVLADREEDLNLKNGHLDRPTMIYENKGKMKIFTSEGNLFYYVRPLTQEEKQNIMEN